MKTYALFLVVWACFLFVAFGTPPAHAQTKQDILVLGDSQISASGGNLYLDFFGDLERQCSYSSSERAILEQLGAQRVGAIGVSSTSLRAWTARSGGHKDRICAPNKRFGVNAGVFGFQGSDTRRYVQIGEGRDYQLCQPNRSPLQNALRDGYYDPELLVMALLGNDAGRWANNANAARADILEMMSQIPEDIGCIMLTTAPVFQKSTNDLRERAQRNLERAFRNENPRCVLVSGFSARTRDAIEGRPQFFARREDGSIRDPLHPQTGAMQRFFDINRPALCAAVIEALK